MTVRRATPEDAAELTRLRREMFEAWGSDASAPEWLRFSDDYFRRRLAEADFAGFLVDGPDGRPVASGVGWVNEHLPAPHHISSRRGQIASMSTTPSARGQGHARAIFEALLGWFAEIGVSRVELRATAMGEPLYRSYGFREPGGITLTWSADGSYGPSWTRAVTPER